jgi:hypothetical protein
MWATMFTRERRPVPRELPPLPPVEDVTRLDVTRQRLGQLPWELVLGGAGALPGAVRKVFGAVRDPKGAVVTAADYVASLRRTLGSSPAERSALLARRGVRRRYLMLDLPVADLGGAAKALGESVNSVYVAAVLGGLARYHELHDAPVPELVVTMPVSVRREQDSHTENRFVGVRIAGPACGFSLAERAALVGERVRAARQEPSLEAFLAAGPVLSRLPLWLTSEVAGNAVLSDVQVSNIAGWPHAVHFGDIPVTGFYGFGPFAAAGLMVLLVTADDRAFVGVHLDADAVTDAGLLRRCLGEALAELSGLARSRTSA